MRFICTEFLSASCRLPVGFISLDELHEVPKVTFPLYEAHEVSHCKTAAQEAHVAYDANLLVTDAETNISEPP